MTTIEKNDSYAFWQNVAESLRKKEEIVSKDVLEIATQICPAMNKSTTEQAATWVNKIREDTSNKNQMNSFFTNMDLSSEEGISLMCLAEALLRIPDNATKNAFLAEHLSESGGISATQRHGWFAHAAHWGLLLGSQIVGDKESKWQKCLQSLVKKAGAPLVRQTVLQVMRALGQHFVMGESIDHAIARANKSTAKKYTYSYDMLGEAAITLKDADKYFQAYQDTIKNLSINSQSNLFDNPGVSIKLSALYPRYEIAQQEKCIPIMVDRLVTLGQQAKLANISITIDAEEIDRLLLSLEIFQQAWSHPQINYWHGFGLAVQAYTKAATHVVTCCIKLARENRAILPIRLVKGAYWDFEIKQSQIAGIRAPVWTRKAMTDASYLACAKLILAAKDCIYPQFATHNAHTVAAITNLFKDERYEFQCLHGMGQILYDHILKTHDFKCRIYAPVGSHKTLLPYLVRRLLENGANSSFVHQLVNSSYSINDLTNCPIQQMKKETVVGNPKIASFEQIFANRKNSQGLDLNNSLQIQSVQQQLATLANGTIKAQTKITGTKTNSSSVAIMGPIVRKTAVGEITAATQEQVEKALVLASKAYISWSNWSIEDRANCLEKAADLLMQDQVKFMDLCIREAGKTWQDAVDEIREAVDFLRYYAQQSRITLAEQECEGPTGEENIWRPVGRGVILCLSPWNFPLAIFIGQVSAALAAGNTVLAKPSSQTAIIAHQMLSLLHQAGVPKDVCQLLPGGHKIVGSPLVADPRIKGVMLTGSTNTAKTIAINLAQRPGPIVPFIAETGGQNAMIIDSSALLEQSVLDVVESAFKSAGQRCSACRVLFLQEDIADEFIEMLAGSMAELVIGDPSQLSTDVGPVIDEKSKQSLNQHLDFLDNIGAKLIFECNLPKNIPTGSFFAPRAYEIDCLSKLKEEVFGPVLHIVRYSHKNISKVVDAIHATGYGLTVGIHSRMPKFAENLAKQLDVGNVYINRNMIGAVVGVQPFGGNNLSGTGPKAGGPWYLTRLSKEQVISTNTAAIGGNASLLALDN